MAFPQIIPRWYFSIRRVHKMPSKIKVLIIDHSDINRQDVFHQLENQNYAVSEADCEDEALKHKPALFDVIVTEINLPYRFTVVSANWCLTF
jgi:response regulator RpfG family c-di-GMP phosphodiesterase